MSSYLLAIDQGTTSSRAMIFDPEGGLYGMGQQEFPQYFPHPGWVEHRPAELWQSVLESCREALLQARLDANRITAIGISNQRETTLVWDRATGQPVYPAIVWQDRRTADHCERLKADGHEAAIQARTGLLLDPYFSATKLAWILDQVVDARQRAERGELAFGTVDSFLLWQLTGGRVHRTDASNASRTLLFNIHEQRWDPELLRLFDIPPALLPEVMDTCAEFATSDPGLLGASLPVRAMAGDQQAALVGQGCLKPGMAKSTYGTGCFLMLNTGARPVSSSCRLLTTVAYRIDGQCCYALEGSIFMAGATVQWLRDALQLIPDAASSQALAARAPVDHGVYLVPAFTGLGAPHWQPQAQGAIVGLSRSTGLNEVVSAALQSVGYQTLDLLKAMADDGCPLAEIRVDGGMVANDGVLQFLADLARMPVDRPRVIETTALGAAFLAGLQSGCFDSLEDLGNHWQCQRRFQPLMDEALSERLYRGWQRALQRVL